MERPQRLAVHDQRNGDIIWASDTIEMVLDIANHKADLVEVREVIDHFQLCWRWRLGGCAGTGGRKGSTKC